MPMSTLSHNEIYLHDIHPASMIQKYGWVGIFKKCQSYDAQKSMEPKKIKSFFLKKILSGFSHQWHGWKTKLIVEQKKRQNGADKPLLIPLTRRNEGGEGVEIERYQLSEGILSSLKKYKKSCKMKMKIWKQGRWGERKR